MKNNTLINKQQGMTLIEMMVALMLGAFLLAGVMQIFLNSKRTYQTQDNMSRIQENGRFALEFLGRDIRNADYWGCVGSGGSRASSLNNLASGNPVFDYDGFANGVSGTNNDTSSSNNIVDGTDTITLTGVLANNNNVAVLTTPTAAAANIKVTGNSGLAQNDVVVVSDCTGWNMFQITNISNSGGAGGQDTVVHNQGNVAAGPGNSAKPDLSRYAIGSQIYTPVFSTYIIRTAATGSTLSRSINGAAFQTLIEGVSDMQILYGEDTTSNGTANYYVSANNVVSMANVISVRITLTIGDGGITRNFSSTIVLRNRLLN